MSPAETDELAGGFVASPLSFLGFTAGWVGTGLVVAWFLARRGHDRRTMGGLGVGLGPLMIAVAIDTVRHRERTVHPLVVEQGAHRQGALNVLVVVDGGAEAAADLAPALASMHTDLGDVTLVRCVGYEWIEHDIDNQVVAHATAILHQAAELLPVDEPSLVLLPGPPGAAIERFTRQQECGLVLFAVDDDTGQTALGNS